MTALDAGIISHAIAALAFLALLMLVAVSWERGPIGGWLIVACGATAIWALVASYSGWNGGDYERLTRIADVLRTAGWLGFLLALLSLSRSGGEFTSGWRTTTAAVTLVCVVLVAADIADRRALRALLPSPHIEVGILGRLILSVIGLLLVENLLRNTRPEHRWSIKFLCFGIGGLFAYDFFMYSEALLYHRVNPELNAARGATNALIVPLLALSARRNPDWSIDIFVSRRVVFHSATLIGAGIYLLVMSGVGFYLREYGGQWGVVLQAMFLFAAILMLLLIVFSGAFRARMKDMISKNFFSYKYDYREEWLRFIDTIASTRHGVGLPLRVMEGIANIVESPEGAIWAYENPARYALLASWNAVVPEGVQEADPAFGRWLEQNQSVIKFDQPESNSGSEDAVAVPAWLRQVRRAWLIVPLLHHDRLLGIVLLCQPRAPRQVGPEDYVLLTTVGRQAASYLAEQQAGRALVESQQFDQFNRRFAFVLHDIKNLVSQLSLMLQNAQKHKNNPSFQEDMLETVKESVDKMYRLLVRLHRTGKETAATALVGLPSLLRKIVERTAHRGNSLSFESDLDSIAVVADEERLGAVFAHLLDNAFEAIAGRDDGRVIVRLDARGGDAVIEVTDNGSGMDENFVRDELFRPFRTTKNGGFGIGVYESREFVRELGGRMEVASEPGRGTRVQIWLPAITGEDKPEHARHGFGMQ
jgi:putative PEP-CTERM system histidine kinase